MIGLSTEVREWLRALRAQDLAVARPVGEAVTVLLLDPHPPVRPLETALREEDSMLALDFAYQRQLDLLKDLRHRVANLATERMNQGGDDQELRAREEEALLASQRLQTRVNEFRHRKETAKAARSLALAKREINEALDSVEEGPVSGLDADAAAAQAATDELFRIADEIQYPHSQEFRELKLDALDLRLLFAEPSAGSFLLLVVGMGVDNWEDWYDEAVPLAADESTTATEHLAWYGLGAFLSEFFAGEEAVIRAASAPDAGTAQDDSLQRPDRSG
jgi:hypothetical protein